jgi:hypothetical protein
MKILFVYNAKPGLVQGFMDSVHKVVSPETYPCSLCALTYGAVAMKREWKTYLAKLPYPVAFAYRDAFRAKYPAATCELPAAFLIENGPPQLLISAVEIAAQRDVNGLVACLSGKLHSLASRKS